MNADVLHSSIHRRNFLRRGVLAAAGAVCAGSAGTLLAADATRRSALGFIAGYSDSFSVCSEGAGVTRLVAEVRDVPRLGAAFQGATAHGIARLHVAGTLATFQIGGRIFEVENLCPADFAARNS